MSKKKDLTRIRAHQLQLGDTFVHIKGINEVHMTTVHYMTWSDADRVIMVASHVSGGSTIFLRWDEHVYVVPTKVMDKLTSEFID